ncbi:MAG: hypothetical protein QGI34_17995 [Candidatus Latescibacteria bacterium]|nr:hypothetical protein [Candidatus Latescibacterota bacterium]
MMRSGWIGLSFLLITGFNLSPAPLKNTVGRMLPDDAAPLDQQVYRYLSFEPASLDIGLSLYQSSESEFLFERHGLGG